MRYSIQLIDIPKLFTSSVLLFFICLSAHVNAQIMIEENIFTDRIGKTMKEVLYETDLDIDGQLAEIKAAIGPDQIWDFSNFNYIDSTVTFYELMVVDPDDPFLQIPELAGSQYVNRLTFIPGSGGVEDNIMTYIYTSLIDSEWTVNGSISMVDLDLDGSLDTAIQYFVPANLQIPFPVTSTSMWYDSTNLITLFDGMEFISSIMIDSNWVQGYGTLITPYGTAEALRVHNKSLNKNPFLPIVDESNDYDFVTENDLFSASIVVEDGRAFHSVRTIVDGGPLATFDFEELKFKVNHVSPNPFENFVEVDITMLEGEEVTFRFISANGTFNSFLKKQYLNQGTQRINISTQDIPAGVYYLEIRSGKIIQHIPVTKI
ncbi:MAG: T9SS type A sorting domain-containing protein [Saprospiraceae bacterium]|nr:T9SS type A sorting domain-containing protein [Saprospiraceae bacterium]